MKWDEYYLEVCKTVAKNSKCLSRKIGAILVKDKSIVSTGYNGPPRGVVSCNERWGFDLKDLKPDGNISMDKCPRYVLGYKSGEGLHLCNAGHAERNALINAARNGIKTKKTVMYMDCGVPCVPCLVEIINAGVTECVCTSLNIYGDCENLTFMMVEQSGIKIRSYEGEVLQY